MMRNHTHSDNASNTILTTLLSITLGGTFLLLGACGAGNHGGTETDTDSGVSITTTSEDSTPTLTTTRYSGSNTTLLLNQTGNSTLSEYNSDYWLFTASGNEYINLILSGPDDSDMDLMITDLDGDLTDTASDYWSSELIVVELIAGHQYQVQVESITGGGDYQLTLATLSRSLLEMTSSEYLLLMNYQYTGLCNNQPTVDNDLVPVFVDLTHKTMRPYYSSSYPLLNLSNSGFDIDTELQFTQTRNNAQYIYNVYLSGTFTFNDAYSGGNYSSERTDLITITVGSLGTTSECYGTEMADAVFLL
jgi:hypothetical protein